MPPATATLRSALANRYAIDHEIGRGGMATVYLARDVRHDRLVAVKVLSPELTASVGTERFVAEIQLTAKLGHPNILPVFDSGVAGGTLYYVMPYVVGESLGTRLAREGPLPVNEAVHIASGVAAALDHAHRAGIVHRDLKPENILLADGEPVVADFGIALVVGRAAADRVTATGISLGTPQYMSPEQAAGDRNVDGRSDIFSLAAVVYEMLTGESPFAAPTAQAAIARIMTESPRAMALVRPLVPASVVAAVDRGLAKIPADRWKTAGEFAAALTAPTPPTAPVHSTMRKAAVWLPWTITAIASAAAIGLAIHRGTPVKSQDIGTPAVRFIATFPDSAPFAYLAPGIPLAVAPNDRFFVYRSGLALSHGQLYVRSFVDMSTRPIPGTDGDPTQPAVGPDSKTIAYVDGDRIVTIPIEGGSPRTLTTIARGTNSGLLWATSDTIIASNLGTLVAIPLSGGNPIPMSRPDSARHELAEWGPHVTRDGRFIFYISVNAAGIGAYRVGVIDRRTGRRTITEHHGTTLLGETDGRAIWVKSTGEVVAAPIGSAGELGPEQTVMDGVLVRPGGAAKAAMSDRGTLVYQGGYRERRLVLVDMSGKVTPFGDETHAYSHPRWSPDGAHLAITINRARGSDIWTMDASGRSLTRLTSDGVNDNAEWAPDGVRLTYRAVTASSASVDIRRADGTDAAATLLPSSLSANEAILTRDGRRIVFRTTTSNQASSQYEIEYLALGAARPQAAFESRAINLTPALSPNERWLAYASDENGTLNIYVRPFLSTGPAVQVSDSGGQEPVWSADGKTIYYRRATSVMAASLSDAAGLSVATRRKLFTGFFVFDATHNEYDVAPDQHHFLMVEGVDIGSPTIVVHGWANELRAGWR
ncbi:MAG TPA: protein kinase [Gemmatimonadaceae bacterium]|nr:protein kinase [Gemmatimonadaceae bacterium]